MNPSSLCQQTLWANNNNPIWLASSINLFRNVEKYKFPGKLDVDRPQADHRYCEQRIV